MKRIKGFALLFSLLLTLVIQGISMQAISDVGGVTVSVHEGEVVFHAPAAEESGGMGICALYRDGRLETARYVDVESTDVQALFSIKNSEKTMVKIFMWKQDGLMPIADSINYHTPKEDAISFASLPAGSVKATGWLERYLRLQADNITGDFEQISLDVASEGDVISGWLGGTGESWERGTYYVKGLVSLAYVLDDAELKAKAQKWIDWTLESQKANGLFGPHAEDVASFDWWAAMPMLHALQTYYDATVLAGNPDARVIAFMKNYFNAQRTLLPEKPLTDWGLARVGDNIDAVMWLYEKTKEPWLSELCQTIYQASFWDDVYGKNTWIGVEHHIVNIQQSVKLFPLMYKLTGDIAYRDLYYRGTRTLDYVSGRKDGMTNGDEVIQNIYANHGTETCAVVERMLSEEIALTYLRDARIADRLELIAYNAWPAMLKPDMTGQVYFNMQNQVMANLGFHGFSSDGGDRSVYGMPGGFPCCAHNFHMGWPLFVKSMWMKTSDGGLAVGAYGPCSVTGIANAEDGRTVNYSISEETTYPFEETVTFRITADGEAKFPLHFRIPEWSKKNKVMINGVQYAANVAPGDYFTIEKTWRDKDEIQLVFYAEIELSQGEKRSVSVKRGPLVYVMAIEENYETIDYNPNGWHMIDDKYKAVNITAAQDWNYALYALDETAPQSFFTLHQSSIDQSFLFTQDKAPIYMTCAGVRVPSWTIDAEKNICADVPTSPVRDTEGTPVTLRLLPFGFTKLRITLMPRTGKSAILPSMDTVQAAKGKRMISSIIFNQNKEGDIYQVQEKCVTVSVTAEKDVTVQVEVNGIPCGSLALKTGTHEYEIHSEQFSVGKYNCIEFLAEQEALEEIVAMAVLGTQQTETQAYCMNGAQAETLGGAIIQGDHVASIDQVGDGAAWKTVTIQKTGVYHVKAVYASVTGGTHTLLVDGSAVATLSYGTTAFWGSFDPNVYAEGCITLSAGVHTLSLIKTATDTGFAEVQNLQLVMDSNSTKVCLYAQEASLLGNAYKNSDHIAAIDNVGDGAVWQNAELLQSCMYRVRVFYASPTGGATHTLMIDNKAAAIVRYGTTQNWGVFDDGCYAEVFVTVERGAHSIALMKASADTGFAEVHRVEIEKYNENMPISLLAIGGTASGNAYITATHAAGINNPGDGLEWYSAVLPQSGKYDVKIYYASPSGGATHTLQLDQTPVATVQYGTTTAWGDFSEGKYAQVQITLEAGSHTLSLIKGDTDTGFAEIKEIVLTKNEIAGNNIK